MSKKHRELQHYLGTARNVFDTHAHIYSSKFAEIDLSIEQMLHNASLAGVNRILIAADDYEDSNLSIEYANKYNGVEGVTLYASVGMHPHNASDYNEEYDKFLSSCLEEDFRKAHRIMALGEIGLDYYYDFSPREVQKEVFAKMVDLAYEYDIPFILHEREATKDCLDILIAAKENGRLRETPGVCHCCSCSAEVAKILVKMGFYLGFDGPVTYKNNRKAEEVLAVTPLNRIVVETDSPYLTPEPNRGKINEPAFVPYVLERVAEIKNITIEEACEAFTNNGKKLFGIED